MKREKKRKRTVHIVTVMFAACMLAVGMGGRGAAAAETLADDLISETEPYTLEGAAADVMEAVTEDAVEAVTEDAVETTAKAAAEDAAKLEKILSEFDRYPAILLSDLERNPEMLDFVAGFLTADQTAAGEITDEEKKETCPLFLQWDKRWGYRPYGSCLIATSGCGPVCLSMVLFSLTRDETLTPAALGDIAAAGYYVPGTGTSWGLMTDVAPRHGVKVEQTSTLAAKDQLEAYLRDGALFICSMRPGDFTNTGHFIVVRGMENGQLCVNDPFSLANSQKNWDYDTVASQCKQAWRYWK